MNRNFFGLGFILIGCSFITDNLIQTFAYVICGTIWICTGFVLEAISKLGKK